MRKSAVHRQTRNLLKSVLPARSPYRLLTWALPLALGACGGGDSTPPPPPPVQTYTIGGSVSGLSGATGIKLQNGSGDAVTIASNGTFTLPDPLASGTSYVVSISEQPSEPVQSCSVANGTGTVGSANITNVAVSCDTTITADSVSPVATLGNNTSETLLQLAAFLGERINYLAQHAGPNVAETCSDPYHQFTGGTAAYTLQDNDATGSLSTGDTVTMTFSSCRSQSMAANVSGTVTLQIVPPSHAPQGVDGVAATATLNGLSLTGLQLTGPVNIEYDTMGTEYDVYASVGATPLQFSYVAGGFFQPDSVSVSNATASKLIDYTQPRYAVQLAETFTSQNLKGTFTLTTPQALTGRLNVYPDTGMEEFSGGPSRLRYGAQNVDSNGTVDAELDADGSGGSVTVQNQYWNAGVNGFLWWEPRGFSEVVINSRPAYTTTELGSWQLALMFTAPQQADPINQVLSNGIDVITPIWLFFNGPVDPATAVLEFDANGSPPGPQTIPAVPDVEGPIVTLRAQTQLQHGATYQLGSPDFIHSLWQPDGTGALVSLKLTTLNNVQAAGAASPAVAAPGQFVQLTSTGSSVTIGHTAQYLWTQTGGPVVTLSNAATATASFPIPATANSGDSITFTLTVTTEGGSTDTVPVTVFVLSDLTQPFLYYHAQQIPGVGQVAEMATFESTANGTVRTEFNSPGPPASFKFIYNETVAGFDLLQFMPGTPTIAPGTYTSSIPGNSPLSILSYSGCGTGTTLQMTVYEAEGAADGTAAKFSADFTLNCPGESMAPIAGSVRVNSTHPLP